MDQITLNIPDPSTKAFVEKMVSGGDYPSVNDYLLALIRDDRERRKQARLQALVLEGLEGGESIVMTDEVWDKMLRDFEARHPEVNQP